MFVSLSLTIAARAQSVMYLQNRPSDFHILESIVKPPGSGLTLDGLETNSTEIFKSWVIKLGFARQVFTVPFRNNYNHALSCTG